MAYREITGNLIDLAVQGQFEVIAHGCNCQSTMRSGIAPKLAEVFHCNEFPLEKKGPSPLKLGNIDWDWFVQDGQTHWHPLASKIVDPFKMLSQEKKFLAVVNCYTQNYYGRVHHTDGVDKPLDYEALTLCMRKMNIIFTGKTIGLPKIGAGLAGGDWNRIKEIIKAELKDCDVTVVLLP